MVRWVSAVVGVALAFAVMWVGARLSGDDQAGRPVAAAAQDTDERADAEVEPGDQGRGRREATGPPPWVKAPHGGASDKHRWHAAWRAMSPRERERVMSRLAEQHAAGMRSWSRCVSDGRRDDCDKPLPPGQAKKQLRP